MIYTLDHQPAHVHAIGPGQAKINLVGARGAPELAWSFGVGRNDMHRLMAEVVANRDELLAQWERIHGPVD